MTALLSPLLNEVCVRFTTGSHGVQGTPTVPSDDPYRIVFFVPLLRLFSIVRSTRVVVFGVLFSLHAVLPLLALLLVVEYVYALIGVWLFAGYLSKLPASTYVMLTVSVWRFHSAHS